MASPTIDYFSIICMEFDGYIVLYQIPFILFLYSIKFFYLFFFLKVKEFLVQGKGSEIFFPIYKSTLPNYELKGERLRE